MAKGKGLRWFPLKQKSVERSDSEISRSLECKKNFSLLSQVPFAWMPFNVGFTFGCISSVLKIFSLHLKKKKLGNPCGGHWGLALLANIATSWRSKKSNLRNRLLETQYRESFHTKPVLTHIDFCSKFESETELSKLEYHLKDQRASDSESQSAADTCDCVHYIMRPNCSSYLNTLSGTELPWTFLQ